MILWREALAYIPSILALALLLAGISHASFVTHEHSLAFRAALGFRAPLGLRDETRWLGAATASALLALPLAWGYPAALITALGATLLCAGALLLALDARPPAITAVTPASSSAPRAGPPEAPAARLWLCVEAVVLFVAAPVLLFPTLRPALAAPAAMAVVLSWVPAALQVARPQAGDAGLRAHAGAFWPRSANDLPLALLTVMAVVGSALAVAQGPDAQTLALSKALALFLGLAAYRLTLRALQATGSPGREGAGKARTPVLAWAVALFLLLGLALAAGGLLGGLRYVRFPVLAPWLTRLPRLFASVPETQQGRVSLNQLGGMLLLVQPLALAVAIAPRHPSLPVLPRVLAGIAALGQTAALILTQSRGAWLGGCVAAFTVLLLWGRRGRALALVLIVAAMFSWVGWGRSHLGDGIVRFVTDARGVPSALGTLNLNARIQIWTRTLASISESPWLGNGLGTYRLPEAALAADQSPFDGGLPHAHNAFLQVAYDLGLPGLVAYLALLILALRQAWHLYARAGGIYRALSIGALAGLTGFSLYGITDTLAVGSKPAILYWMLLALVAGAGTIAGDRALRGGGALRDTPGRSP